MVNLTIYSSTMDPSWDRQILESFTLRGAVEGVVKAGLQGLGRLSQLVMGQNS